MNVNESILCLFLGKYRTRANKGRGLYSKNIFWPILAANNRERLLFKNCFSQQLKIDIEMTFTLRWLPSNWNEWIWFVVAYSFQQYQTIDINKSDTNAIQLNEYNEMSTCTVPSWYLREEDPYVVFSNHGQ